MDLLEAIRVRHSVRSFTDKKIDVETELFLRQYAEKCNKESGLNIQLCLNEPKAFDNMLARYGRFDNCKNYIVLAGREGKDEECGYYGEKLVLINKDPTQYDQSADLLISDGIGKVFESIWFN